MNDVIIPEPQPDWDPPRLTVKEYLLDPARRWQVIPIHDGWRPLAIRGLPEAIYLAALVNTGNREEAEVIHIIRPGEDMLADLEPDHELGFLGDAGGRYVFLEVKIEQPNYYTARRIGRLDLEESSSSGVDSAD